MGHNRAGDHVRVIKRRRRKEQARLARKAELAATGTQGTGIIERVKNAAGAAAHTVGDAVKATAGAVKHAVGAATGHDKPKQG